MGSERTVEDYVKAVKKFVGFLGESDPESALTAIIDVCTHEKPARSKTAIITENALPIWSPSPS
jgi:hypothetical protein